MSLTVLVLGGAGTDGTDAPALLAEHRGRLVLERLVDSIAPLGGGVIFAMQAGDLRRFRLDSVIALAAPDAVVIPIDGATQGAACTALLCIDTIGPDDELLVLNANEIIMSDYQEIVGGFRSQHLDAGVVTFPSLHPRYSYVALNADGLVEEAAEKRPISRNATAGFYWFRRGSQFAEGVQAMIRKDNHVDGRFYISLVFNELILGGARIGNRTIDAAQYQPLKSGEQIHMYESARRTGDVQ
jgi:hypothetical protein